MRNTCLYFLVLSCVILPFSVAIVFAQLPNFNPYFDRKFYELGSTGTVTFEVKTFDNAYDISMAGVKLHLPKSDGTNFETEFFGDKYDENPLQIPANTQIPLNFNFRIPDRNDLESGNFFYLFEISIRPQNTTEYTYETYGPEQAQAYGEECILYVPQSIPSPTPTAKPTPTPIPLTPTPTLTPNPTDNTNQPLQLIEFSVTEIALIAVTIIAIILGIIAIWALKRK